MGKMGRPKGTKNKMRTPEEKEKILKEYYFEDIGRNEICKKYKISTSVLSRWRKQYEENGITGLESNTGKLNNHRENIGLHFRKPKTYEEELELKIMKLEIENARLKKGYAVKGVGAKKEYVTTFDKNMKS